MSHPRNKPESTPGEEFREGEVMVPDRGTPVPAKPYGPPPTPDPDSSGNGDGGGDGGGGGEG